MARKDGKDRGILEWPNGSGKWWARLMAGGRERRYRADSKTAAKALYAKLKTEVFEQRFHPEKYERRALPFSELVKDRLAYADAHHRRPGDDDARMQRWTDAFGSTDATAITPGMIERVLGDMRAEGYAPATIARCLVSLKATYNRAVRDGRLKENPAAKVKPPVVDNELVRYLTAGQEADLLAQLPERFHSIVKVAAHTGLRQGELLRLQWQDLDWTAGILTVNESKTGKRRRVPMNSTVQGLLAGRQGEPSDRVFAHDARYLRRAFDKAVTAAGLAPFRFHDLRHTFASRLAMQGVNDRTLMTLGGWSTSRMLNRYAHLSPTHLWQAVEGLVPGEKKASGDPTAGPPDQAQIQTRTVTKP